MGRCTKGEPGSGQWPGHGEALWPRGTRRGCGLPSTIKGRAKLVSGNQMDRANGSVHLYRRGLLGPISHLTPVWAALGRLTTIKTSALPRRGDADAVRRLLSETDSSPMTLRRGLPSSRLRGLGLMPLRVNAESMNSMQKIRAHLRETYTGGVRPGRGGGGPNRRGNRKIWSEADHDFLAPSIR